MSDPTLTVALDRLASGEDLDERGAEKVLAEIMEGRAGEIETALMLALHPERVRMDRAENFRSSSEQRARDFELLGNGRSAKLAWQTQDLNPSGAVGNAAAATAANGQAVLDAAGRALARLLTEIDRLPPDTLRRR